MSFFVCAFINSIIIITTITSKPKDYNFKFTEKTPHKPTPSHASSLIVVLAVLREVQGQCG